MNKNIKELLSGTDNRLSSGRILAIITVLSGIAYLFYKSDWQGATAVIGIGLASKTVAGALE